MKSGASRDRMSRLRPLLAAAAAMIALAGAAMLAATAPGVAHATPLFAAAATPTLDPLIVPTAASTGSSLSGASISTSSSGVELAVTLSCITTIAGLIIASITLTALLRTGYGPFLRALLPRWLRRKATDPAPQPTLRYKPRANGPETGFDIYAESPTPRGARRPAPRDEWSDWDDQPARQPRSSQAGRGSSRGGSSRGSSSRASRSRY